MTIADAELVARSRRHDSEAFGVLVGRHQRLVFGVALARCQDPALAEDVAQEAFVTAWRDLDRLRDVERVGSWVAGIARNLAAKATRARTRRADALVPDHESVPTPEDELLAREDRELLQRALAEVPEAHRETLVLYYMEGQSVTAIAKAFGIREDLVKQRLSRGRRALRDGVQARIETALTRARTSPAFRAGVVTAIVASGARNAKAATAGKVMTMFATKKAVIAGTAAFALAGGTLWVGTRARAQGDEPVATTRVATQSVATTSPAITAPNPPDRIENPPDRIEPKPSDPVATVHKVPQPPRRVPEPIGSTAHNKRIDKPAGEVYDNPQRGHGELRGFVRSQTRDSSFGPKLSGASVVVSPGNAKTETGTDGTFTIDLPAGAYKVKVTKAGFKDQEIDVTIDPNGVTIKQIELQR